MQATCSDLDDVVSSLVAARLSASEIDVAVNILSEHTTIGKSEVRRLVERRGSEQIIVDMVAARLGGDVDSSNQLAYNVLNVALHETEGSLYPQYRPLYIRNRDGNGS